MAEATTAKKVLFEKMKRVGVITLNNGEMNVFDKDQVKQLVDLLKELEGDEKVRVILIQGSGTRAFSSGFDLKNPAKEFYIQYGKEMIHRLYYLPKPTIALIHGYSIGIGLLVTLACDFRYATEDASVSLPEINYNIMFPTHGGCTILSKLVRKPSDAKYILYTGDRLPASQAAQMGLIDAIFKTKEEMYNAGMEFAQKLSSKEPIVMSLIKVALKKCEFADLKQGMDIESEAALVVDRGPKTSKEEQLEASRKYIDKYSEKC